MGLMIRIARASTIADYADIERLQKDVWQFDDREIIPRNELITIARNGGVVLGAWDGAAMIGFVFGFLGLDAKRLQHASRMLAVLQSGVDVKRKVVFVIKGQLAQELDLAGRNFFRD